MASAMSCSEGMHLPAFGDCWGSPYSNDKRGLRRARARNSVHFRSCAYRKKEAYRHAILTSPVRPAKNPCNWARQEGCGTAPAAPSHKKSQIPLSIDRRPGYSPLTWIRGVAVAEGGIALGISRNDHAPVQGLERLVDRADRDRSGGLRLFARQPAPCNVV